MDSGNKLQRQKKGLGAWEEKSKDTNPEGRKGEGRQGACSRVRELVLVPFSHGFLSGFQTGGLGGRCIL